jgi:hypothetical protein
MPNTQTSVPAFTAGQVLTAAQMTEVNTGIPVFATTTTRDAAFGGTGEKTLAEGQMAYVENLSGVAQLQYYDGAAWVSLAAPALIKIAGETSFSAATNVYANDIFTSSYNFYRVVTRYYTSLSGNSLFMRLQGLAANYNYQTIDAGNVTVAASRSTGQGEWNVGGATNGAYWSQSIVDLGFPNTAEPTTMLCHAHRNAGAYTSPDYQGRAGNNSNATAYNGIELLVTSGTMTGSYTVYGYTK